MVLEPWQLFLVSELLRGRREPFLRLGPRQVRAPVEHLARQVRELPSARAERVYLEGYIQVPKKNGKSLLASALSLFLLIADGEAGAEVYAAASAKDQARIVFGAARRMLERSPALLDHCKLYRDAIEVPETDSVFRVLSADAGVHEGIEPHAWVADELHRHHRRELYDVLSKGAISRERPIGISITNAGADLETVCGEVYRQAIAAHARKPGSRRELYCFCPQLGERDTRDVGAVKRVNPASWITTEALARERRRSPAFVWDRYNANRWTRAEESWLPAGAWEACAGEIAIEDAERVYAGVDFGVSHDHSAVVELAPAGRDKQGRLIVHVRMQSWATWPDPEQPPPEAHTVIEGRRVPLALLEDHLRRLGAESELAEVAYDPWRFGRSAELLEDEGLVMVEFPMSNERMAPASQALFDAIIERRLRHDGDPILAAHIAAAVARDTERGWRLDKTRARRPMDGAIALAIALARAEAEEAEGARPSATRLA